MKNADHQWFAFVPSTQESRNAIYELCREIEINPDVEHELRQRFAL